MEAVLHNNKHQFPIIIRQFGLKQYVETWQAMQAFNKTRTSNTADEIWLLQHPPVYTLGLKNASHPPLIPDNAIPVIQTDRGGDISYHGPGQLIVYFLIDITRSGLGVRQLVQAIEQSVIDLLDQYKLVAYRINGAPGVYINQLKIASLGLRIKKGSSYHGLSLNVNMDLAPFGDITPCGSQDLIMTQLADWLDQTDLQLTAKKLIPLLLQNLGYNTNKAQFQ